MLFVLELFDLPSYLWYLLLKLNKLGNTEGYAGTQQNIFEGVKQGRIFKIFEKEFT